MNYGIGEGLVLLANVLIVSLVLSIPVLIVIGVIRTSRKVRDLEQRVRSLEQGQGAPPEKSDDKH